MTIAIGAISGTAMDGIDVSIVETDGRARVRPGAGRTYAYDPALRAELLALVGAASSVVEVDPLVDIEARVSDAHADAVLAFMRDAGVDAAAVDVVGLHGQTVWHRPERRFTRQLGDGARMARRIGRDVVNRFRHADVAAGGEGAPFAPLYHRALAASLDQPVMVLNLGGVGNVTYIDGDTVVAFDTGPASALLDDLMLKRVGRPYDEGGRLAASGRVDAALVAELMRHPHFARPAPKSLDRNEFHAWAAAVERLGDADAAATLTAFTVGSVADALRHVPSRPRRWLVTGGGRLNATIMGLLAETLRVPVDPVEVVGWNGDFIEAQCFAYLAVRSLKGLPLSLPTTTGVPAAMPGGELWKPA